MRLLVAYDGTRFRGFALNPGVATVAGRLMEALELIVGHEVSLTCAGRTDAGVHAWGQVVTFDADPARVDPRRMRSSLNSLCRPEIVVREVDLPGSNFDARYQATSRAYRYTVLNRDVPDPFSSNRAWLVTKSLDLDEMNAASSLVVGTHDFASFCRRQQVLTVAGAEVEAPRTRRVLRAGWHRAESDLVRFEIEATSFCHQMVRGIVGTLVEVGMGLRPAEDVRQIIEARDRNRAGRVAPPHGLMLWHVGYD